jgi:hypothetical protein
MSGDVERLRAALALLALVVLGWAGMWWGWRRRARRHADLPAPAGPPAALGEPQRSVEALYVGTTTGADWLDRVVAHGLGARAGATMHVHDRPVSSASATALRGVVLERDGAPPLWIPAEAIVDVRLERALAGKVVERHGLLVVRWQLGEQVLASGLRLRSVDDVAPTLAAVQALRGEQAAT